MYLPIFRLIHDFQSKTSAAGITFFEEAQANAAQGTHYRLAITCNAFFCTVLWMQILYSGGQFYISRKPEIHLISHRQLTCRKLTWANDPCHSFSSEFQNILAEIRSTYNILLSGWFFNCVGFFCSWCLVFDFVQGAFCAGTILQLVTRGYSAIELLTEN